MMISDARVRILHVALSFILTLLVLISLSSYLITRYPVKISFDIIGTCNTNITLNLGSRKKDCRYLELNDSIQNVSFEIHKKGKYKCLNMIFDTDNNNSPVSISNIKVDDVVLNLDKTKITTNDCNYKIANSSIIVKPNKNTFEISYKYISKPKVEVQFCLLFRSFIILLCAIYSLIKNRKNICNILFLSIFFILLWLPTQKISDETFSMLENRKLAPQPIFINDGKLNMEYTKEIDDYFNDRFWGRGVLSDLFLSIQYKLNRIIVLPTSILNKKTGETFLLPLSPSPLVWKDKNRSVEYLNNFYKFCTDNGIKPYLLLVPSKNSIYYDHAYPYNIGHYTDEIDNAIEYLDERTKLNFVYPKDEIYKLRENEPMYFNTDHHWTDKGAFIGYKKLMGEIKKDFSSANIVKDSDLRSYYSNLVRAGGSSFYPGHTIYFMMHINEKYYDEILTKNYEYLEHKDKDNMEITSLDANKTRIHHYKNSGNNLKVYAIGTSMTENLMEILPYSFKDTTFHRLSFVEEFINYKDELINEKPDILVVCIVHDNIPSLIEILFGGF